MTRAIQRTALGLTLAASCLTMSCASLGKRAIKPPVVSLRSARLVGLGVSGGELELELGVFNPNGYRLDGERLTYNVVMDTVTLGNGALDKSFSVRSHDSTDVVVPVSFSYAGIGAAGRRLLTNGTVDYRVTGVITVGTPIGRFTRAYNQRGHFSTWNGVK